MQYEAFGEAVKIMIAKKEAIIKNTLKQVPGLRRYMTIHSVFELPDKDNLSNPCLNDWLVKLMVKELVIPEDEIKTLHKKDDIPQDILDQLSTFDPKPLGFEKYYDGIRIEYDSKNRDPINVIDVVWEKIDDHRMNNDDIENFIAEYETIDVG